jgi:hypothetical protein
LDIARASIQYMCILHIFSAVSTLSIGNRCIILKKKDVKEAGSARNRSARLWQWTKKAPVARRQQGLFQVQLKAAN